MKQFNTYRTLASLAKGAAIALLFNLVACGDSATRANSSSNALNAALGTMTDNRDGRTYKTVTIGKQTWMAENLNFESDNSLCMSDITDYCNKYGRLYTWAAAMDSAAIWGEYGKGCGYGKKCYPSTPFGQHVRGVCPEGWHLPTNSEWSSLMFTVGNNYEAAENLKSTSGWLDYKGTSGNGTDDYGFSALPAGYRDKRGYGGQVGSEAHFWTSTEDDENKADFMYFTYSTHVWYMYGTDKQYGRSVRCVMDA